MGFTFDFTLEKLAACIKRNKNPQPWFDSLYKNLPDFDIITPARVAGFVSQCQHESSDFTILTENLNYSAKRLMEVFGKYFPTSQIAAAYDRKPQLIANRVYASRLGNGPEESGDGWKFRGRGLIQLTGRWNYTTCSQELFGDTGLADEPDLVINVPEYTVLTSCWFWRKNKLNDICDRADVVLLSKKVNGGNHGLEERIHYWNRCLEIFES